MSNSSGPGPGEAQVPLDPGTTQKHPVSRAREMMPTPCAASRYPVVGPAGSRVVAHRSGSGWVKSSRKSSIEAFARSLSAREPSSAFLNGEVSVPGMRSAGRDIRRPDGSTARITCARRRPPRRRPSGPLALPRNVQHHGHRADVEGMGADVEQVVQDAGGSRRTSPGCTAPGAAPRRPAAARRPCSTRARCTSWTS